MQTLTIGKHNPKLVGIRKAVQHDELTGDGLLPVEGPKLLDEALKSGIEITDIFVQRGAGFHPVPTSARTYELEPDVFKSIQSTETSQGIIVLVRPPTFSIEQILSVAKWNEE